MARAKWATSRRLAGSRGGGNCETDPLVPTLAALVRIREETRESTWPALDARPKASLAQADGTWGWTAQRPTRSGPEPGGRWPKQQPTPSQTRRRDAPQTRCSLPPIRRPGPAAAGCVEVPRWGGSHNRGPSRQKPAPCTLRELPACRHRPAQTENGSDPGGGGAHHRQLPALTRRMGYATTKLQCYQHFGPCSNVASFQDCNTGLSNAKRRLHAIPRVEAPGVGCAARLWLRLCPA
jgi:hypothetical protein